MNIYKISYANNEVISCKEVTNDAGLDGSYHYVHSDGRMIYAIVKAENEAKAIDIASKLPDKTKEKV